MHNFTWLLAHLRRCTRSHMETRCISSPVPSGNDDFGQVEVGGFGELQIEKGLVASNSLLCPILPFNFKQLVDYIWAETHPDNSGGITRRNTERRHIVGNNGSCADHSAIAHFDTGKDHIVTHWNKACEIHFNQAYFWWRNRRNFTTDYRGMAL